MVKKLIYIRLLIIFVVISVTVSKVINSKNGAIVANGIECAEIGANILRKGGSAVDAAITTLLCDSVSCPHTTGLGGGFFMTIYIKDKGIVETLDAREVAPLAANETMFVGRPEAAKFGGLAVAVPGQLKGLYEAHQKYGKLPWREVIEPVIHLAMNGVIVSDFLEETLKIREIEIFEEPSLREIFINPKTNQTWKEGEVLKQAVLAKTLEIIAKEGSDALYSQTGSLIKSFIRDIKNFGGIITEQDMINYKPYWDKPDTAKLQNGKYNLFTKGLSGSGSVLMLMMNILDGYKLDDSILTYHRLIETFKFGYASRTHLGDKFFVHNASEIVRNLTSRAYADAIRSQIDDTRTYNDYEHYGADYGNTEDHGTDHVSVLAPNGDAVAVTGTINLHMGAMLRSPSLGFMLNDEMDDFSTPNTTNEYNITASPANYIKPGKRPMSSMVPSIILDDKGTVKMVIGAAGGSKITSSVTFILLHHLYLNYTLNDAMHMKRLHHQLAPMYIQYETGFDQSMLGELQKFEHDIDSYELEKGFAAVVAISRNDDGKIRATFDPRRGGSAIII